MGNPPAIVLYDGGCGMCSAGARRGQRYQRAGALRWVDNGSDEGQALLRERGLLGKEQDTLIVLDGGRTYVESAAVVRSARGLRWPWKAAAALWVVPKPLRDFGYRQVSARRARHTCRLPVPPNRDSADPEEAVSPRRP